MQNISWKVLVLFVVGILVAGFVPAKNTVAGKWIANVGKINFKQDGSKITGSIKGYGGQWDETFVGTLTDNTAVFNTVWFGDFTLIFEGDTFKSGSPDLAFCGIRPGGGNELPSGCGFSGKWNVPANSVFLEGSYIELKQAAGKVSGTFYNGDGTVYDTISGDVYWGKGWTMNGVTKEHGQISLNMNAAETGFMIITDDFPIDQRLCAIREGQTSAYLMFYYCGE